MKETKEIRADAEFMTDIKKGIDALNKGKAGLYSVEDLATADKSGAGYGAGRVSGKKRSGKRKA